MTWRPLLIFFANFIAGWLLTHGYINPADHNATAQGIADGLGYFILGITSVFSLVHALKHPTSAKPVEPAPVPPVLDPPKAETLADPGTPPVDPGTPPA